MPTPLRRRLRLARRGFGYTVAVLLVLVAVVLGIVSQVLPLAERNPERVAAWLSERAGRPVAFDRVVTEWTRRGPLLQLANLRIGEGEQAFTVGDTEMLVSLYAGLLPGQSFSELRLRGLDMTLERANDGRWQVRGLPGQDEPAAEDPLEALEGLGELQVIGGKLAIIAPALGINARVPRIDLRLRVSGDRARVGARAWPQLQAAPLDAVLDFDRKRGDGKAYAGAKRADLSAWAALLQVAGIAVEGGQGRAEAWAELRDHRVEMVTVDAALDSVSLRGAPILPATTGLEVPRSHFTHVRTHARWRLIEGGWRLDAPALRIGNGAKTQVLDGLVLAGGVQYALLADKLDAAPLLAVAGLSDRLSPALRQWLLAAKPQARVDRIRIAGQRGGPVSASADIVTVGFEPVGHQPGLHGLAGHLEGDADGFTLQLDPAATTSFNWPSGFGVVHAVKLRGAVNGWREGAGWRIGSTALHVQGNGYAANTRGGLWWQGDGSRPWIDIATEIEHATLPVAKGFWVRHLMPKVVVDWLDTALVSGEVRNGRAIVTGDLDDWPFSNNNGRFEANAHIGNGTLKFQPDWPAADSVEIDASFIADGFTVDGTGRLGGIDISRLHAGIDHYGGGALVVEADAAGDAAQMLEVLRRSPLQKLDRETFASIQAKGPAVVDFGLKLPLHSDAGIAIDGSVDLKNGTLADPRYKLAFDQVRGRAQFTRTGFHADGLSVRHEGQPGQLALRVGEGHVREGGNLFEAGLDAHFNADALIDHAPDLAWLAPYLDGRSEWNVGVTVPKSQPGKAATALLKLRSDLVGTRLDLPEPLRKRATAALATTVETPLPMGTGDVQVGLGNRMALRARSANGQTGVRAVLGVSRVDQAAPVSGLVATGRAGTLDAIDWIALARGGGGSGGSLPLERIDVVAEQLQLLGGTFPDTHVIVVPAQQGATAVTVDGTALKGALLVPADARGAVAGQFERVHWRSSGTSSASGGSAPPIPVTPAPNAAVGGGASAINPANIPPLRLEVGDLRFADARLGAASLRTQQTATGMRIEQFQTRAEGQRIDVNGDWSGTGTTARTRFDVSIDSDDFGDLLGGFGFKGRLAGGEGNARLDAAWAGSPAEFALGGLDGSLVLDARDGRLLELEPGAGRVLGLLSIAELPRRLMLDFGDFFSKGFAFNKIGGKVRFADGHARSDDLVIDGPAATIAIRGSANLRAQSFDQTIEVRPKAGNLLTAVGAIAAGPVGAAIGAAANAMLQKPLGAMAAKTYRVTGPWTDPKVEVISRDQSRVTEAPPVPAG